MPSANINGSEMYWEEAGSGDALILIHGACSSSKRFSKVIPRLTDRFRVLAIDLRGMGQSAHVPSIAPSAWSDDVGALIKHLGLPAAHVYGVSLGARVALRTAIDNPSLVSTLCLDMPIIANDEAGNSDLLKRFDANASALSEERQSELRHLHGEDWENVFKNYSNIRSQADVQGYLNLREPSKSVTVPTFIMRGDEENEVHPLRHAVELHENIAGSWLWINPKSRGGMLENATDASVPMLERFISNVAGRVPVSA